MLALLDESGGGHHIKGHQRIQIDKGLASGEVDCVLWSKLFHNRSCASKRTVSIDVDVERLGGPPSKSVMFDIESGINTRVSASQNLLGMSIVGQFVPSTSQFGGTDYGTSEKESIARKKADEPVGGKICAGSAEDFHCVLELKPSLILVLFGQSSTQATLPGHC